MMAPFSFSREERLKRQKMIARLFAEGRTFVAYPFKVVWLPEDTPASAEWPAQIAITVPKRVFKTAVARNLLKRRTREAYRLNKAAFYAKIEAQAIPSVAMMLIYIAKESLAFAEIEAGMLKMIRKFEHESSKISAE